MQQRCRALTPGIWITSTLFNEVKLDCGVPIASGLVIRPGMGQGVAASGP
jgi:hypothetical protein